VFFDYETRWRILFGAVASLSAGASTGRPSLTTPIAEFEVPESSPQTTTVWLTLEQIQLVGVLLLFGSGVFLRKSL
jgi:hypothetical protein